MRYKVKKTIKILQMIAGAGILTLSVIAAISGFLWVQDLSVLYPTTNISLGTNGSIFIQCAGLLYIVVVATGLIMIFQPLLISYNLTAENESEVKK
jgi:TRAP-type C4-dicarboxylate transport system permease small subunit